MQKLVSFILLCVFAFASSGHALPVYASDFTISDNCPVSKLETGDSQDFSLTVDGTGSYIYDQTLAESGSDIILKNSTQSGFSYTFEDAATYVWEYEVTEDSQSENTQSGSCAFEITQASVEGKETEEDYSDSGITLYKLTTEGMATSGSGFYFYFHSDAPDSAEYAIEFGDGQSETSANPFMQHTYDNEGMYTYTGTVTAGDLRVTKTGSIYVGTSLCPVYDEYAYSEYIGYLKNCSMSQAADTKELEGYLYSEQAGWVALSDSTLRDTLSEDSYDVIPQQFAAQISLTGETVDGNPKKAQLSGHGFSEQIGFVSLAASGGSTYQNNNSKDSYGLWVNLSSNDLQLEGMAYSEHASYIVFSGKNQEFVYNDFGVRLVYGDSANYDYKVDGYDVSEYVYKRAMSGADSIDSKAWDYIIDRYKEHNFTDFAVTDRNNTGALTAPSAVENLASSNVQSTSFDLTWDASDNASGYKYQIDTGTFMDVDNTTTASVTELKEETTYTASVVAYNDAGDSEASSIQVSTQSGDTTPDDGSDDTFATPSNLTGNNVTQTGFTLAWDSVTDAQDYEYEIASGTSVIQSGTTAQTSEDINNLEANTSYDTKVRARSGETLSDWTSIVTITTQQTEPPATPDGLATSDVTQTGFFVSWNAVSDANGYEYALDNTGSYTDNGTQTGVHIDGLDSNTSYTVYVRAYNDGGASDDASITQTTSEAVAVTSDSYASGATIPIKHARGNENISPHIQITSFPDDTDSFAITMEDPDGVDPYFAHWALWNISTGSTEINEDTVPSEATVGSSDDFGDNLSNHGYQGPEPPEYETHTYELKVFALDADFNSSSLSTGSTAHDLHDAMDGHILGEVTYPGTYTSNE